MSDPGHKRRTLVVALLLAIVIAAAAFRPLHDAVAAWSARAALFIDAHSVAGAVVFVLLSILSAMLAFFSTAVLIPVAVTGGGLRRSRCSGSAGCSAASCRTRSAASSAAPP